MFVLFVCFCLLVVLVRLSVPASDLLERPAFEMTCNVLMGTLNHTHSLSRYILETYIQDSPMVANRKS